MDFKQALDALWAGKKVFRKSWKSEDGKHGSFFMRDGDLFAQSAEGQVEALEPYDAPEWPDILATDWEIKHDA